MPVSNVARRGGTGAGHEHAGERLIFARGYESGAWRCVWRHGFGRSGLLDAIISKAAMRNRHDSNNASSYVISISSPACAPNKTLGPIMRGALNIGNAFIGENNQPGFLTVRATRAM